MPILRAYGGRPSTRRSPNRMSPPSTGEKPAIMRSSVVLPQPDGPSSVNSSPSPISSETWSTAVAAPNRLVTSRSAILIRSRFLPDRFDVAAEPRLERLRALGGHGLVVDVRHVAVEVRAEAAGELHRHLRRRARRALHLVPRRDREQAALHEDLLAALAQEELDEGARRLWITRAGEDGHRLRRDEGVLRRHELQLEAGELLLEGHIRWHREPGRIFSLRHDGRNVPTSRGEVAGVGGQLLEPVPALLLPVHRQDHLVRRVRRRRARGRAPRDLALEPGLDRLVPLLRLGHAEALDLLGVIDQAVGLQRGADPVAVAVLQRDRLGLGDRRGDRLPRLARDLDLLEELLVGELLEERRLAAPEDVHLRLALPFDDAAVCDRRAGGYRAHFPRHVPLCLPVLRSSL